MSATYTVQTRSGKNSWKNFQGYKSLEFGYLTEADCLFEDGSNIAYSQCGRYEPTFRSAQHCLGIMRSNGWDGKMRIVDHYGEVQWESPVNVPAPFVVVDRLPGEKPPPSHLDQGYYVE